MSQIFNQVRSLSNPAAFLQNAAQSDPAMQQALSSANGDYEKAFRSYARSKGVDPEQIISQIRGMM